MSNPRRIQEGQDWLIDRGRLLQIFKTPTDELEKTTEGFCFGVAQMAKQAILANDLPTFDRRLQIIYGIPLDKFVETIEKLKETRLSFIEEVKKNVGNLRKLTQEEISEIENDSALKDKVDKTLEKLNNTIDTLIKEGKPRGLDRDKELEARKDQILFNLFIQKKIDEKLLQLSENQRLALDIPTFFEGIELYQKIGGYGNLLSSDTNIASQNENITSSLVLSKELEEVGGTCELANFSNAYTVEELADSLHDLSSMFLQEPKPTEPIAFVLGTGKHAITIGYDPELERWMQIDTNFNSLGLPTQYFRLSSYFDRKEASTELAKAIFSSFNNKKIIPISMKISVTKNAESTIKPIIDEWVAKEFSKMTPLPKEKLESLADGVWLNLAVRKEQVEIVKLLLVNGANPDLANEYSGTPLVKAALLENIEMVKLLLDNKANPDLTGKSGITPLVTAVLLKNIEMVKLLLDNKANPDLTGEYGFTPLVKAVGLENIEMVKLLLDNKANPDLTGKSDITPLVKAVLLKNIEMVKLLLDNKANPDLTGEYGFTPLVTAVGLENLEMAKLLLANGANPDLIGDGVTPLGIAIEEPQNIEMVKLLLANGANPDLAGEHGVPPLRLAIESQNVELVKLLLNNKANPDLAGKDGITPLDNAIRSQNVEMVKLLLANGANPSILLLLKAKINSNAEIVNLLLHARLNPNPNLQNKEIAIPLYRAVYNDDAKAVSSLLNTKPKPNLNLQDIGSMTLLHRATLNGNGEIVGLLLDQKADPNIADNNGSTPLFIAAKNGRADIVNLLLAQGADPSVKYSTTIESLRELAKEHKAVPLMEAVISAAKNKKINTKNSFNLFGSFNSSISITAIDIATAMGHTDIAKLIIEKEVKNKASLQKQPSVLPAREQPPIKVK